MNIPLKLDINQVNKESTPFKYQTVERTNKLIDCIKELDKKITKLEDNLYKFSVKF